MYLIEFISEHFSEILSNLLEIHDTILPCSTNNKINN
jgi:hypothetical protein